MICAKHVLWLSVKYYLLQQCMEYIIFSYTNMQVMIVILFLMSMDMVLSRLSNVRLSGIWVRPHLFIIFSYCKDNPILGIHVMHC